MWEDYDGESHSGFALLIHKILNTNTRHIMTFKTKLPKYVKHCNHNKYDHMKVFSNKYNMNFSRILFFNRTVA